MTALATAVTSLTIVLFPQGVDGPHKRWTLRCGPPGGTHPAAAAACRRLNSVEQPFRPVPADAVCTEIYGGPDVAIVAGTFRGRRVWARFNRTNGCHIARWDKHRFLLPKNA